MTLLNELQNKFIDNIQKDDLYKHIIIRFCELKTTTKTDNVLNTKNFQADLSIGFHITGNIEKTIVIIFYLSDNGIKNGLHYKIYNKIKSKFWEALDSNDMNNDELFEYVRNNYILPLEELLHKSLRQIKAGK